MAIVDPTNGKVVGRVPVGQDPHELAVSDDGKLAFASNYSGNSERGGNSLSVIDIAARKELHHVELSPLARPHGLWFAGGKLYFTAEANMAIGRYDPAADKIDWLLGTGQERTHMVLVARDLKTIFTSNVSSNTISIIERTNPPQGRPGGPPGGGPGGPPGGGLVTAAGWTRWSAARETLLGAVYPRQGGPVDRREVDRAGNNPSSRWVEVRKASTSRRMANRSGRLT